MGLLGDIVDTIVDAFNGGPSNWRDRLAGEITFLSPEGNEFKGYWRGSPRSTPKKLGILRHPKIKGDLVQDMEVSSTLYPITFYFAGENHDTEAAAFHQSCKEKGPWEITHPVHGFIGLQLISVEEIDSPVEEGNITTFNTEWIEPIDPLTLKTARELKGIIDGKVKELNISAAQQFANDILDTSNSLRQAIESTTDGIQRVTDVILGPLFTTVDALDNAVNAIQNGIQDTYNATVIQALLLAGQIQNLITLPLFSSNALESRIGTYESLTSAFVALLPGEDEKAVRDTASDDEKRNSIATTELALTAVVASLGRIVTTTAITPKGLGADDVGTLATRAQAIKAVTDITSLFNDIVDELELAQEAFSNKTIDKQYYCFNESYTDAALVVYLAVEYLLRTALELSVERRFTIDRPRAPIEIVISEYGGLGEKDANLDLFIRSNDLHGKDIMLLPRGREVVVYA